MRFLSKTLLMSVLLVPILAVNSVKAHASTIRTLKEVPKNIRGTWYTYEYGKYHKDIYYRNKIVSYYDGHRSVAYIHKLKDHNPNTASKAYLKKTSNWEYLMPTNKIHGYHWIKLYGWNQGAGAGGFITLNHFNGHEVLSNAGDAGIEVYSQSYRTKQLAHKKYPKFKYAALS